MIDVNIDTVLLYRKDLKEDSRLKQNNVIEMCDFIFDLKTIIKKELVIFSDGNYTKILISRHF